MSIYSDWMIIKNVEREAVAKRREIEDEMLRQLQVDDVEGSQTLKRDGFKVRVTNRYNRKVDSDLLQLVAQFKHKHLSATVQVEHSVASHDG